VIFGDLIHKLFGDRKIRLMNRTEPLVQAVRARSEEYRALADADFPRKTEELIARVRGGKRSMRSSRRPSGSSARRAVA
jgi:preprotein translocase subunit SecA